MKILSQITERLTNVAMVTIIGLMFLTAADVFMRYVFSRPIQGVAETTELAMVVITFFAIGSVTFLRKHIAVDLVVDRFSPRVQAIIEIFTSLISVGICGVLSWRGFVEAVITNRLGIITSQLDIPESPFYFIAAIGFGIVSLIAVFQLVESIIKAVKQ